MRTLTDIDRMLAAAQEELERLDLKRKVILEQIDKLKHERALLGKDSSKSLNDFNSPIINDQSSEDTKISLFRTLFRGREDVYARRYESVRTGKTGYFPASRTKGGRRFGEKPDTGSDNVEQRDFLPLTDEVIRNHLLGRDPQSPSKREFTIGIYPLLLDETCCFLVVDFD